MSHWRGLYVGLILFPGFLLAADVTQDPWKDVDLGFDKFRTFVSNEDCHTDRNHFLGCAAALNSLLRSATAETKSPTLALIPKTRAAEDSTLGPVLKTFGNVSIVERKRTEHATLNDYYKFRKAERDAALLSWDQLSRLKERVDFDAVLNWYQTEYASFLLKHEKPATLQAFTALFEFVIDADARLEFTEEEDAEMTNQVRADFGGIGATLNQLSGDGKRDEPIYIANIQKGSVSEKVGLRINDIVTHVKKDGANSFSAAKTLAETVSWIRGPRGTSVELKVLRLRKHLQFRLKREQVKVMNVEAERFPSPRLQGKNFDYVSIANFHYGTADAFEEAIEPGLPTSDGVILDLRGNGGGIVGQALQIAEDFLGEGKTLLHAKPIHNWFIDKSIKITRYPLEYISERSQCIDQPLVVLVDARSASASEVLASALQDHGRAWIVGLRTFGKGTMQEGMDNWRRGLTLIYTTRHYETAAGRDLRGQGVTPDFVVGKSPSWGKSTQEFEEENFALRYNDQSANPQASEGTPWIRPPERRQETLSILRCVADGERADRAFERAQNGLTAPDYQRLFAEDVLDCLVQPRR